MSKRYYLCRVVGDGTEDNPFRPKVVDYPGVSHAGPIDMGADGRPLHEFCLVAVSTNNHGVFRNDPDIDPMPEFPLDGKMSAIQNATKNGMLTALARRGFDTSGIGSADGFRDALQGIGLQISPRFDIDGFDAS